MKCACDRHSVCKTCFRCFREFLSIRTVGTAMAGVLFEDIFNVKDIDPEGKKFDRGKSIYDSFCVNYVFETVSFWKN